MTRILLNGVDVHANILPTESEVLDETLDTLSFAFLNDDDTPCEVMSPVTVEEGETQIHMVLISDSVEPYEARGRKFRHMATATERSRLLSKWLVRNSVFSQPPNRTRYGHNFVSGGAYNLVVAGDTYYEYGQLEFNPYPKGYPTPLQLSSREKAEKAWLKIKLQVAVKTQGSSLNGVALVHSDIRTMDDLNDLISSPSYLDDVSSVELYWTLNGTSHTETLTADDFGGVFRFNEYMECPRIKELLDMGAGVYVRPVENYFLSGEMYYQSTDHIPFFAVDFEIKADVYYYTAYDVLELLLKRHRQARKANGEANEFERADPFVLPENGELYDLLKTTIAPNFTFTQCTLYEAVAEVFRLFDAIFTMDENDVLGICKFNDRQREVSPAIIGMNSSLSEERRANAVITNYQDARHEENFPSSSTYAPSRTAGIGIPDQADHVFSVPHPIEIVLNCEMEVDMDVKIMNGYQTQYTLEVRGFKLDLTPYIVEETLWSGVLDTTSTLQTADPTKVVQNNSVYYSQGDNKIQLSYSYSASWGTTYYSFGNMMNCALWRMLCFRNVTNTDTKVTSPQSTPSPDWKEVYMRLHYITSEHGRIKIESPEEKTEGEMMIDQSNGAVDLNNLGANILGLSMKLGQPTLHVNLKPFLWANRVKKGDYTEWHGDIWVANACTYTPLGNGYYQGSVSFVKNYNELSLRKSVLREKRLSNISRSLTVKSEDNITEFAYFSAHEFDDTDEVSCFDENAFAGCLLNSFGGASSVKTLDYCYYEYNSQKIYLPLLRYGAGNAVHFEVSFADPISAGIRMKTSSASGWFGTVSYYSEYVIYPDEDGFADSVNVCLAMNDEGDMGHIFPVISSTPSEAFSIVDYGVYKQPNEVFALNYSLAFLPGDYANEFVGREFIDNNFFIGELQRKNLRIYYSGLETYSSVDRYGKGLWVAVDSVSVQSQSYGTSVTFSHSQIAKGILSWSVCDNEGKILFAFNGRAPSQVAKIIYFQLRRTRL